MNITITTLVAYKGKNQGLIANQFDFIEKEHVRDVNLFNISKISCGIFYNLN